jgi:hypothetical protein
VPQETLIIYTHVRAWAAADIFSLLQAAGSSAGEAWWSESAQLSLVRGLLHRVNVCVARLQTFFVDIKCVFYRNSIIVLLKNASKFVTL